MAFGDMESNPDYEFQSINADCQELRAILATIIKKCKNKK